jgi:hypothetical protein
MMLDVGDGNPPVPDGIVIFGVVVELVIVVLKVLLIWFQTCCIMKTYLFGVHKLKVLFTDDPKLTENRPEVAFVVLTESSSSAAPEAVYRSPAEPVLSVA